MKGIFNIKASRQNLLLAGVFSTLVTGCTTTSGEGRSVADSVQSRNQPASASSTTAPEVKSSNGDGKVVVNSEIAETPSQKASSAKPTVVKVTGCKRFEGTTIAPESFEEVFEAIPSVPGKGEFETTAQYNNRLSDSGIPEQVIISKFPESPGNSSSAKSFIPYDADSGILTVQTYVFHNTNIGIWEAKYNATPAFDFDLFNRSTVIDVSDIKSGSYTGTNAYGASVQVTKINRLAKVIVEPMKNKQRSFLPRRQSKLGAISMQPDQARAIKDGKSIVYIVKPAPPYKVTSTYIAEEPTIRYPYEVSYDVQILVGRFECSLLIDPRTNEVLAAYTN